MDYNHREECLKITVKDFRGWCTALGSASFKKFPVKPLAQRAKASANQPPSLNFPIILSHICIPVVLISSLEIKFGRKMQLSEHRTCILTVPRFLALSLNIAASRTSNTFCKAASSR